VRWRDSALIGYGRSFEHPFKVRIVRWLTRRLSANRVLVRYAPGAVIGIDPADYVGWTIFKTGHYERASLSLALRLMRHDPGLFVDVGAGFGWYTCALAAVPGSCVISVEPDCESCAALRHNIALNKLQHVAVFAGAVGRKFESVRMIRRAPANSGTTAIVKSDDGGEPGGNWVATTPLEALLERIARPPFRPVLVKVDVEGFERQVLSGLDFFGRFRPKNILMEFVDDFDAWGDFSDVQEFFAAMNYQLCDVLGRELQDAQHLPEANIWARDRAI
jgi:FkbM family methyltransferase